MTHFDQLDCGTGAMRPDFYARAGKRLLDLGLSLLLLPVLLPVIALSWAATKAQGGPGFYAHSRIGQHGRVFRCYKIRTMLPDSERILHEHLRANPQAAEEWALNRKLRHDPRVTRLGRFLRRTSLDELPQILNVLRGEMSLVGPRPITAEELDYYAPAPATYLDQRPGVTGPWQVHGRLDGCYSTRVRLDRAYRRDMSLAVDLDLIWRTALTLVRPTGC
ncbi:sugar transferase [Ruegeria marisrubri]|nr:sugar transferase [Ruegeria marisrubri]